LGQIHLGKAALLPGLLECAGEGELQLHQRGLFVAQLEEILGAADLPAGGTQSLQFRGVHGTTPLSRHSISANLA
jgi:hypothetical protein